MFFIDLRAAGCGQISDKYQHYGLVILPDAAAPGASRSRSPSRSRDPVAGMRIRFALVSALMAVSGCTTLGRTGPTSPVAPIATPPAPGKVATGIVAAMNGGLIGGSIGSGLSDAEKRKGLEAEYKALEYNASGQKVTWKGDPLWRGRGGPALSRRFARLPPVHAHRVQRRIGRHRAGHGLPQCRRQLDAADLGRFSL